MLYKYTHITHMHVLHKYTRMLYTQTPLTHTKDSRTHGLPLPGFKHIPHSTGRNQSKIHVNRLGTMETNCQSNIKSSGRIKNNKKTSILGVR